MDARKKHLISHCHTLPSLPNTGRRTRNHRFTDGRHLFSLLRIPSHPLSGGTKITLVCNPVRLGRQTYLFTGHAPILRLELRPALGNRIPHAWHRMVAGKHARLVLVCVGWRDGRVGWGGWASSGVFMPFSATRRTETIGDGRQMFDPSGNPQRTVGSLEIPHTGQPQVTSRRTSFAKEKRVAVSDPDQGVRLPIIVIGIAVVQLNLCKQTTGAEGQGAGAGLECSVRRDLG